MPPDPSPPAFERLPPWFSRAEKLLATAAGSVRLLGAVIPENAASERLRLKEACQRGEPLLPRWSYKRQDHAALRRTLETAADRLASEGHPLTALLADRARELELEAALASEAGQERFGRRALTRFGGAEGVETEGARALANAWIAAEGATQPEPRIRSDAEDPESLLGRLRQEVSRRGLPFTVVVHPSLSALAATGERQILVAADRALTKTDVERTVMHEIEGHVVPRVNAAAQAPIFRLGTARGTDDQEGLALLFEERHGFLVGARARELAARHLSALCMDDGASFHDVVVRLRNEHGFAAHDALRIAERTFRGSDGRGAGLGRERVYLTSYLRVKSVLRDDPALERVLTSGQVAVASAATLLPFLLERT